MRKLSFWLLILCLQNPAWTAPTALATHEPREQAPAVAGDTRPLRALPQPLRDVDDLVAAAGDGQMVLTWIPLATSDIPGGVTPQYMVRRDTAAYPRTPLEGTEVAVNPALPLVDSGLANGTTYYYSVFAIPTGTAGDGVTYEPSDGRFAAGQPRQTADAAAPVFVWGPHQEGRADTAIVMSWTASEPSRATLAIPGRSEIDDSAWATARTLRLSDLSPGTAYLVTICLTDAAGNGPSCSAPLPVSTAGAADSTAPVLLAAPDAALIGAGAATLQWVTDEPTIAQVEYGPTDSFGNVVSHRDTYSRVHQVELGGLASATAYRFRVRSENLSGLESTSATFDVATCSDCMRGPPVLISLGCDSRSATSNRLLWTLTADRPVRISTTVSPAAAEPLLEVLSGRLDRHHELILPGLTPATSYTLASTLTDRWGSASTAVATASCGTLATEPATENALRITLGPLLDHRRIGMSQATMAWETSWAATSVVEYQRVDGAGQVMQADLPGLRLSHEITVANLEPGTRYRVVARGTDSFGRSVASEPVEVDTWPTGSEPAAAFVNPGRVVHISGSTVVIRFEANRPLQGFLRYVGGSARDRGLAWDITWSSRRAEAAHDVVLTNVPKGTSQFEIWVVTPLGEKIRALPENPFFTTTGGDDALGPAVSGLTITGVSDSIALVRWSTGEPARALVRFGPPGELAETIARHGYGNADQQLVLTGLTSGGLLSVQVDATDLAGNTSTGTPSDPVDLPDTPDTTPPTISGNQYAETGPNSVDLEWQTDQLATSVARYSTPGSITVVVQDNQYVAHHRLALTGLEGGKTYAVAVESVDGAGNVSAEAPIAVTLPAAPLHAAAPVGGVIAIVLLGRRLRRRRAPLSCSRRAASPETPSTSASMDSR